MRTRPDGDWMPTHALVHPPRHGRRPRRPGHSACVSCGSSALQPSRSGALARQALSGQRRNATIALSSVGVAHSVGADGTVDAIDDLGGRETDEHRQDGGEPRGAEMAMRAAGVGDPVGVEHDGVALGERRRVVVQRRVLEHADQRAGPADRVHVAAAAQDERQRMAARRNPKTVALHLDHGDGAELLLVAELVEHRAVQDPEHVGR